MHTAALLLGVFFVGTGVSHFLLPRYYASLVPAWLPGQGLAVQAAGLANVAAGALVLVPATRSAGAWAAAALIAAYLVSHVDAARTADRRNERFLDRPAGAVARLLVNLGYLVWAVTVALYAT